MARTWTSRLRQAVAPLALLMASLALSFLVAEAVTRWLLPPEPPGTTWGKEISRNVHGLRDRDFTIPKPAGTRRLLVLGDSFTWGVGLDLEDTVVKRLERALAGTVPGRLEAVNAAVPGHNTVEERLLFAATGLLYEPDLVLVIYNLNDIEYLPHLEPEGAAAEGAVGAVAGAVAEAVPVVELDPGEDVTRFSRNAGLRGALLAVERRSVFVRFLVPRVGSLLRRWGVLDSVEFSWVEKLFQGFDPSNPGWLASRRALLEIARLCEREGCRLVVAVHPLLVELERYGGHRAHATILAFCRQNGIRAVDLLPAFEGTPAASHWLHFMDAHPNAEAHRRVAEHLTPILAEELRQLTRGPQKATMVRPDPEARGDPDGQPRSGAARRDLQ